MRQKSQRKYNQSRQWPQRDRDQRFGQPKYPDKALSREGLAPVGPEIFGGNARF
jgi:hypothetical protein